jgi:ATP-dependent exoDNAse (exonuclease V) alpha subunit
MTQSDALHILKTGANVFLTGSAGSGKTFVLNQYIDYLKARAVSVAVTATTGVAATHMQGMTIHSWSGLGIRDNLTDRDIDDMEDKKYLWDRFEKTKVLIIDEISMMHGYRLDMIDRVCKAFKRNELPFGGIQLVVCGDFFQLPPVTREISEDDATHSPYTSSSWKNANFTVCYLTEQHRQNDMEFLDVLNGIRTGKIDERVLAPLRTRYKKQIENSLEPTKLYTHNVDVDSINEEALRKIDSVEKVFDMVSKGKDGLVESLKKSVLAHTRLRLKVGAQVMFVKNNFEAGYANGTRGIVESFLDDGTPVVKTVHGKSITAEVVDWAIEEDGKIKASVSQIPLRHAWAITVHKSQGMSLDTAVIDLSKSFTYGMGYVALSRVRSLAGLSLMGMHKDALLVDPDILAFDEDLQIASEDAEELVQKRNAKDREKLENQFIVKSGGTIVQKEIIKNQKKAKAKKGIQNGEAKQKTHLVTKEFLDKGMTLEEVADERGYALGTIITHLEMLKDEEIEFPTENINVDEKLVKKVAEAIKKLKEDKLTPIKSYLEKEKIKASFDEIRLARLFI